MKLNATNNELSSIWCGNLIVTLDSKDITNDCIEFDTEAGRVTCVKRDGNGNAFISSKEYGVVTEELTGKVEMAIKPDATPQARALLKFYAGDDLSKGDIAALIEQLEYYVNCVKECFAGDYFLGYDLKKVIGLSKVANQAISKREKELVNNEAI